MQAFLAGNCCFAFGIRDKIGKCKDAKFHVSTRYPPREKEMQREVQGITAKMLSKELKELEVNELVLRTVRNTTPVTVEYKLTEYGKTLDNVIEELRDWGTKHRRRIIKKNA
jgi:DNA-binding HxlR family transcriptional regulator